MKMKTSELSGAALDYAVALIEGQLFDGVNDTDFYSPSSDWSQGGAIIEREKIAIMPHYIDGVDCIAFMAVPELLSNWKCKGNTPLIAAMLCYVASKLGEYVDIPR